jgi:hypothetical protein
VALGRLMISKKLMLNLTVSVRTVGLRLGMRAVAGGQPVRVRVAPDGAAAGSGAAEAGSPAAPDGCALRVTPPAGAETLDAVVRTASVAHGRL